MGESRERVGFKSLRYVLDERIVPWCLHLKRRVSPGRLQEGLCVRAVRGMGREEVLQLLLRYGVDPNSKGE